MGRAGGTAGGGRCGVTGRPLLGAPNNCVNSPGAAGVGGAGAAGGLTGGSGRGTSARGGPAAAGGAGEPPDGCVGGCAGCSAGRGAFQTIRGPDRGVSAGGCAVGARTGGAGGAGATGGGPAAADGAGVGAGGGAAGRRSAGGVAAVGGVAPDLFCAPKSCVNSPAWGSGALAAGSVVALTGGSCASVGSRSVGAASAGGGAGGAGGVAGAVGGVVGAGEATPPLRAPKSCVNSPPSGSAAGAGAGAGAGAAGGGSAGRSRVGRRSVGEANAGAGASTLGFPKIWVNSPLAAGGAAAGGVGGAAATGCVGGTARPVSPRGAGDAPPCARSQLPKSTNPSRTRVINTTLPSTTQRSRTTARASDGSRPQVVRHHQHARGVARHQRPHRAGRDLRQQLVTGLKLGSGHGHPTRRVGVRAAGTVAAAGAGPHNTVGTCYHSGRPASGANAAPQGDARSRAAGRPVTARACRAGPTVAPEPERAR
jgi:hypothetical protein